MVYVVGATTFNILFGTLKLIADVIVIFLLFFPHPRNTYVIDFVAF
jgi:hypothetical protein